MGDLLYTKEVNKRLKRLKSKQIFTDNVTVWPNKNSEFSCSIETSLDFKEMMYMQSYNPEESTGVSLQQYRDSLDQCVGALTF